MMKLIIAIAFLAVASAHPEPIRLPPAPQAILETVDFRPLIIPNDIIEKLSAVPAAEVPAVETVQVVDAPVESYAAPVEAVQIAEAPVESYSAPVEVVRIADAPVESYAAPIEAVQIAEAPVESFIAPADSYAVKFVDAPIEIPVEAVRFVEEAENVYEKLRPSEMESVRVVDLPLGEETQDSVLVVEQPLLESPRYPGKQYANPTWR